MCESLGEYIFGNCETTMSDDGLIKQLMMFAKENHGVIRTEKIYNIERLFLLLPIKNLKY